MIGFGEADPICNHEGPGRLSAASLRIGQAGELLCHQLMTVVVEGEEDRGVLLAEGFTFKRKYYEKFNATHYRVCICTKVPCLRKCCPLGQIYLNRSCDHLDVDITPPVYTSDLKLIPDYGVRNFRRFYGNTCQHKMLLEPEVDKAEEFFLLANGSLVLPYQHKFYEPSEFCFENVIFDLEEGPIMRAFVCFDGDPVAENLIVYPIGMIISMPFLLATFIVYSLPELRNLHGKNLMSHVASLLAAYSILVITQLGGQLISDTFCIACGFLIPYSFLATFFWLNVMCFDIWSAFSGFGKIAGQAKEKENRRFILYSLYAWGCPLIILIVMVIIQYAPNVPDFIIKPGIQRSRCYFDSKLSTLLYFYTPMACILICDITLFALTAIKIYKVRRETKVLTENESRRNDKASKVRFNLYLKLFLVMGINWVMEIVSFLFGELEPFWYLTDVLNSLQGLFIFWIFVCNRRIKKMLLSRFWPKYAMRDSEATTSSFKMSYSANSEVATTDNIAMNRLGDRKAGRGM